MSLIESARKNNLVEVKCLIRDGVDINVADGFGCTALYWAAEEGHVECATALLDAKADIDKADVSRDTPLHRASLHGHVECVRVCRLYGPTGGR
jgi:ankyrin repeat protein